MSDPIDAIFDAAFTTIMTAQHHAEDIWKAVPILKKAHFLAQGGVLCGKLGIKISQAAEIIADEPARLNALIQMKQRPAADKHAFARYADDFLGLLSRRYAGYDSLAEFWPAAAVTADQIKFMKDSGYHHLADIAARRPAMPQEIIASPNVP